MAKLKGDILFTGSLGNVTAYKRRDSDAVIIRQKGGPTKKQIKTSHSFDIVRRNNAEFGGRSTAVKWIRRVLWPQKAMADYNFTALLNSLLKPIQEMDTVSGYGKRNILFSTNPKLLEGFSLNRRSTFDSVIRNPVTSTIDKDTGTATLIIPALLPGINFFVTGRYSAYSIVCALGILPDFIYNANAYTPLLQYDSIPLPVVHTTDWLPVVHVSPQLEINLQLPNLPATLPFTLLLSTGIRYCTLREKGEMEPVKYGGAAKIHHVQ